jgi:Phospholipase_D-nuclease N-terminal
VILATDYPLLGVLWTVFYIALWVVFVLTLVHVVADVLRSPDMRGIAKAVWLVVILFVPFLGVMTYVIVRGDLLMPTPAFQARDANEAASRGYLHLRG